jgi:hypothetical protein
VTGVAAAAPANQPAIAGQRRCVASVPIHDLDAQVAHWIAS